MVRFGVSLAHTAMRSPGPACATPCSSPAATTVSSDLACPDQTDSRLLALLLGRFSGGGALVLRRRGALGGRG
jgi:hypothetical protein